MLNSGTLSLQTIKVVADDDASLVMELIAILSGQQQNILYVLDLLDLHWHHTLGGAVGQEYLGAFDVEGASHIDFV